MHVQTVIIVLSVWFTFYYAALSGVAPRRSARLSIGLTRVSDFCDIEKPQKLLI